MVAQALSAGRRPPPRGEVEAAMAAAMNQEQQNGVEEQKGGAAEEDEDAKTPLPEMLSLALISTCDVCYDTDVRGFIYGCKHSHCFGCAQQHMLNAKKDISLLPPKCCNIEIDLQGNGARSVCAYGHTRATRA